MAFNLFTKANHQFCLNNRISMESFQLAYSALTPVIVLTINIAQINHKLSINKYNLIILACQIQIILKDQIMNS